MAGDNDVHEHLKLAVHAATRGDAKAFFLAVAASHALDGITRGLQKAWPNVEFGAIEAIVAESAEALYAKVAVDRGVVGSAGAYLWGTARNKLCKRYQAGVLDTVPLVDGIDGLIAHAPDEPDEEDEDALRAEALRRARALLSRLGGETIVQVMTFIFDAIERGDDFIDNATIASAIGKTPQTVRRSKSRGFQRLADSARQDGFDISAVLEANTQDEDEDEGDD